MPDPTLVLSHDLMRRLDRLARRFGLTTPALAHLFLEAAINRVEHRIAEEQRVAKELEAILVRAILHGDYDAGRPTTAHERPRPVPAPVPPDGRGLDEETRGATDGPRPERAGRTQTLRQWAGALGRRLVTAGRGSPRPAANAAEPSKTAGLGE